MPTRRILYLLLQLHVGLFLYRVIPDRGACDNSTFTQPPSLADQNTVLFRAAQSSYAIYFVFETIVMICILCIIWPDASLSRPAQILPALLVISALSVRARHSGIFGCAAGDTNCCSNMFCSIENHLFVPGCTSDATTASIEWTRRDTYCHEPRWYIDNYCPDGFGATPDLTKCYEYGCSAKNTPYTYYGSRVEFAVVALFGIVGITM